MTRDKDVEVNTIIEKSYKIVANDDLMPEAEYSLQADDEIEADGVPEANNFINNNSLSTLPTTTTKTSPTRVARSSTRTSNRSSSRSASRSSSISIRPPTKALSLSE